MAADRPELGPDTPLPDTPLVLEQLGAAQRGESNGQKAIFSLLSLSLLALLIGPGQMQSILTAWSVLIGCLQ